MFRIARLSVNFWTASQFSWQIQKFSFFLQHERHACIGKLMVDGSTFETSDQNIWTTDMFSFNKAIPLSCKSFAKKGFKAQLIWTLNPSLHQDRVPLPVASDVESCLENQVLLHFLETWRTWGILYAGSLNLLEDLRRVTLIACGSKLIFISSYYSKHLISLT